MEIINMNQGNPVSVISVMTYADAIRIVNWEIKNRIWVRQVILHKMVIFGTEEKLLNEEQTRQAYEIAEIPLDDLIPDDTAEEQVYEEWCDPTSDKRYIPVLHLPTRDELEKAYCRLNESIDSLYLLKENSIRALNPPVIGTECINGKYYAVVDIEDSYKPHIPVTRGEYFALKRQHPYTGPVRIKHAITDGLPHKIDSGEYIKAMKMLKRLIGEEP